MDGCKSKDQYMADPFIHKYSKLLKVVQDLPFWLLSGITVISAIVVFIPLNIDIPFKSWWPFIFLVSLILTFSKMIDLASRYRIKSAKLKKLYHLIPIEHECFWVVSPQPNGSLVTQFIANFNVRSCIKESVSLIRCDIKNIFIKSSLKTLSVSSGME